MTMPNCPCPCLMKELLPIINKPFFSSIIFKLFYNFSFILGEDTDSEIVEEVRRLEATNGSMNCEYELLVISVLASTPGHYYP